MVLWMVLGLVSAAALAVAYGVFVERQWFLLRRYRLPILATDGRLDVLHLSDLHIRPTDERMRRFLLTLPKPDITVITGDIVGGPEAVEYAVEALRPIRGRKASIFVLGSNDLFSPIPMNWFRYFVPNRRRRRRTGPRGRAPELVRLLERDGWVHLNNRKYERRTGGLRLEVLGLHDPHIHRADLRIAPRTDPDAFGLAVVHSPDPAPELAALGYDLVVAGHTHGGQVRLPFVGALVTNAATPPRMARGLFRLGPSYLHVSAGLGTSKYAPFRFLCRPECTLLELRGGDGAARNADQLDSTRSNTAS